uniref:Uncharacterized protein n=1 Tax=Strombidium rassoulzadegani TaxID=1082188 RepID=A0A7S3CPK8_9SPIT|mmetsp:Transcript_2878/g.4907  ORF Transcript_2878/g.4907 Transcript_2878/m.4907 type:complete len:179 (+) Transcript_2878:355-891(+)
MGLHVRLDRVFADNLLRQGPQVQRKNNFIINTGNNMTAPEREIKIGQNQEKYGLLKGEIEAINLDKFKQRMNDKNVVLTIKQIFHPKSNFSVIEKIHHLKNLSRAALKKARKIALLKHRLSSRSNQCLVIRRVGPAAPLNPEGPAAKDKAMRESKEGSEEQEAIYELVGVEPCGGHRN